MRKDRERARTHIGATHTQQIFRFLTIDFWKWSCLLFISTFGLEVKYFPNGLKQHTLTLWKNSIIWKFHYRFPLALYFFFFFFVTEHCVCLIFALKISLFSALPTPKSILSRKNRSIFYRLFDFLSNSGCCGFLKSWKKILLALATYNFCFFYQIWFHSLFLSLPLSFFSAHSIE